MKQFKLFATVLLCLVFALMTVSNVQAADFVIDEVEVDGQELGVVHVERGDTMTVEVWIRNIGSDVVEDLRIKAWIGGYEHDDIEDRTELFDLAYSDMGEVRDKYTLRLDLPDDMEASDEYILHVEAYNDDDEFEWTASDFIILVEEDKHDLRIYDVIFTPGLGLDAGDLFFAVVRVENMGYEKEEDIMVKLSIPELGLVTRTYIDELVPEEYTEDDDEETSMSSDELFLRIPSGTKAGTYDAIVEVEYNRGHKLLDKTYSLVVSGPSVEAGEVSITVDDETKEVSQDKGAVYEFLIANLGDTTQTYTLAVSGVNSWGSFRTDPNTVTLSAGETDTLFVYVTPKENTAADNYGFTVMVKADGETVESFSLNADVAEGSSASWLGVRKGLEIGFAVLLIILVILGIILAARKLGGEKESMDEPTIEEGQTYY